MSLIKHPVKIVCISIADNNDVNNIKNELSKHGEVKGDVFKEGDRLKGGAFLWKHKRHGTDEFVLIILIGRPSLKEALGGEGFKGMSKRGLFNLEEFHDDYPKIPIKDLGVTINAVEVEKAAKKPFSQEELNKAKKIAEKQGGITTRKLKIGCLVTIEDAVFDKLYEELKPHTGEVNEKRELFKARFESEDIGVIIWHHEQHGSDEYWIFLALDRDTFLEGKIFDKEGPDVKKFYKEYGNKLPIIKLGLKSRLEPSVIESKLNKKLKEIKTPKGLEEIKI